MKSVGVIAQNLEEILMWQVSKVVYLLDSNVDILTNVSNCLQTNCVFLALGFQILCYFASHIVPFASFFFLFGYVILCIHSFHRSHKCEGSASFYPNHPYNFSPHFSLVISLKNKLLCSLCSCFQKIAFMSSGLVVLARSIFFI